MAELTSDNGWRGSQEGWLQAAYELLLDAGVDAVKIKPLSEKLKLSRTSFYWFFRDREALLESLLVDWRNKNTESLIERSNAYAETVAEATLNVFDCWLDQSIFDSKFEFAVRSWALRSDDVARQVEDADRQRLEAMRDMFARFGFGEVPADVRARTMYLTQIGYISMRTTDALETRMRRIPSYVEVFTGVAPGQHELNRFFARHGYMPEEPDPS